MKTTNNYIDIEKFLSAIEHTKVEIIQLSKFAKLAALTSIDIKGITIQEISFDCTVEHQGKINDTHYVFKLQKVIHKGIHNGISATKNSLIIATHSENYTASSAGEYICISISIPKELILEWFGELKDGVFNFDNLNLIEDFISIMNKILMLEINNKFHEEYLYNLILYKIGKLLSRIQMFDKKTKAHKKFNNISTFIKKTQREDFSIQEIADHFNVTDRTLRNIFIKEIGLAPKEYQTAIKMNIFKKEIINNPKYSITKIMRSSGMQYQSLLSKNFKDLFGCTPKEYQNRFNSNHYCNISVFLYLFSILNSQLSSYLRF